MYINHNGMHKYDNIYVCNLFVEQPMQPPLKHYQVYLREIYKSRQGMELKWPPVLMKNFINLLCISKKGVALPQAWSMTEAAVHGHVSQVGEENKAMQFDDIGHMKDGSTPRCILVQGAAGSGKTMFSWEVCQRWALGKILQQFVLVVLLPLRDHTVRCVKKIEGLFPHDDKELQEEVSKVAKKSSGKGILFLMEGLDELPEEKRKESSFLMKVIVGRCLPLATVMVTSRPWAIYLLLQRYENRLSQHIEIVGFLPRNVEEYIDESFGKNQAQLFREYLKQHSHIRSLMYIPLNCAIVVEVYRSPREESFTHTAPKTQTELYQQLVQCILLRHLKSHPVHGSKRWNLVQFADLPADVSKQFHELCRIAYKGINNQHQIIFSDLPDDIETLGLMQKVPQLYVSQGDIVSYNFLHLTVQEFLAAYYIQQQGKLVQQKHFNSYYEKPLAHPEIVLLFLSGLTRLKDIVIHEVRSSIFECLFETQNKSAILHALGHEGCLTVEIKQRNVHAVTYCISISENEWKVLIDLREVYSVVAFMTSLP